MSQISGFEARVQIAPSTSVGAFVGFFAVAEFSIEMDSDSTETTNSEGLVGNPASTGAGVGAALVPTVAFKTRVPNPRGAKVTLKQATFDNGTQSPFAFTPVISEGSYIQVAIWPAGFAARVGVAARVHHFPSMLVTHVGHSGSVLAGQPIDITAESDGRYGLWLAALLAPPV